MSTQEDVLSDITTKTTKGELMDRLTRAAEIIHSIRKSEAKKLAAIEKKVRAKHKPGDYPQLIQIIVQGTKEEFVEASEFMDDLEDVLPPTLQRVRHGVQVLFQHSGDGDSSV